jgi:hypothetical protein
MLISFTCLNLEAAEIPMTVDPGVIRSINSLQSGPSGGIPSQPFVLKNALTRLKTASIKAAL